jgi:predicted dehydrogenase
MLRAGVVGLGMMGRNHVRVLQELDGVELVGLSDPLGDRFGAGGAVPVFDSVEALIAHGIDIAVLAAPTDDHETVGLMLAEAGVHTLVEKPLATTHQGAERLADEFERRGLVGAVGHIERFNPALQQLKRRLDEGQAGHIFQVTTRRIGPYPARIRDVGVVKDLATHDIDSTAWVTSSSYASVSARCASKTDTPHEDLVAAVGVLENGIVTSHLVNWLSPMKERLLTVTGSLGAFTADTLTGDLTWFANADVPTEWDAVSALRGVAEGDVIRYSFPKPEPLKTELLAFRNAVLGDGTGVVSMREGVEVVRVAELFLASAGFA